MRNRPFPKYPDDTDYNTNAPSYYDDLARKQKLIELLAKKIWEYEETLDLTLEEISNRLEYYINENDNLMTERLEQWDLNLEKFPENVELLLQEWLSDGTLDHIINDTIFNWKLDTAIFEQFRDSTTAQLQQTEQQINEPSIYRVGKNQKFKTIKAAFDKWKADGKPDSAIINIFPGTYKEFINGGAGNNLTFRGHGKWNTYWISDSGYYPDAPFTGGPGGKELIFENMTIIASHDGTPGWSSTTGGAYALHIDYPGAVGKTIIRDCILVSHQDAALGSGTRKDQEIYLYDVQLFSTAEFSVAGAPGVNHGALFYHTSSDLNQTGQKLVMHNVYAHSVNGPGIAIQSNSTGNTDVIVEAINVIGRSDEYETYTGTIYEDRVNVSNTNGKIKFSQDSKLNNSEKLNAPPVIKNIKKVVMIKAQRDLSTDGEQIIPYDATKQVDAITIKATVDGKIGMSEGYYVEGNVQDCIYNDEATNNKYRYAGRAIVLTNGGLTNRSIGEITSVSNGEIKINWTKMGTGSTSTTQLIFIVQYQ